jgi:hypothetical protein
LDRLKENPLRSFAMLRTTCGLLGTYLNEPGDQILFDNIDDRSADGSTKHLEEERGRTQRQTRQSTVPVIPWLEKILESYIQNTCPRKYLFEGVHGGPINLERIIGSVILPALTDQPVRWRGWHAFGGDWLLTCTSLA